MANIRINSDYGAHISNHFMVTGSAVVGYFASTCLDNRDYSCLDYDTVDLKNKKLRTCIYCNRKEVLTTEESCKECKSCGSVEFTFKDI